MPTERQYQPDRGHELDDWKKHVDEDLARLRQNQHDLRNEMNAARLQSVEGTAELKQEIASLKSSQIKEMGDLKLDLGLKMQTLQNTVEKKDVGAGVWATVGSTIVAALPAICVFIWWLVTKK